MRQENIEIFNKNSNAFVQLEWQLASEYSTYLNR